MEVNGYYFRNILKQTRRRFALAAGEQALYTELIDICNQESWRTSFQVSNGELTTALNCNEKTLIGWRQSLINAGLIKYSSGKSKRAFGIYEMVVETTVKNTANKGTDKETVSTANKGTNPSDYNKLNETKLNETSNSHSGANAPEEIKKETTAYWEKIVGLWFSFYKEKFSLDPTFNASAAKSLKSIIVRIKKVAELAGKEWTEDFALLCLKDFLNKAYGFDNWLRDNFLLPTLSSRFDAIVKHKKTENEVYRRNFKQQQPAGSVSGSGGY